ncbi:MAG: hypothetical protein NTZ41_04895, partial [Sphingobacteriales bacterium]|nr:hypothetical protein [Sphingobacteriales bacterium]
MRKKMRKLLEKEKTFKKKVLQPKNETSSSRDVSGKEDGFSQAATVFYTYLVKYWIRIQNSQNYILGSVVESL